MKNDELKKIEGNLTTPLVLNMHDAADMLGICYRTLQTLVYERHIGFVKIGRHYKFRMEDLEKFIEKNYIKPV